MVSTQFLFACVVSLLVSLVGLLLMVLLFLFLMLSFLYSINAASMPLIMYPLLEISD